MTDPSRSGDRWTLSGSFRADGKCGWVASLPAGLHDLTDDNDHPQRSRLRLLEDGEPIGPGHAVHAHIRDAGGGAFSFWTTVLYFSTSDGTDPNRNGRAYSVVLDDSQRTAHPTTACSPAPGRAAMPGRRLRCALFGLGNRGFGLGRLAKTFEGTEIGWVVDKSRDRVDHARRSLGEEARGTTNFHEALADTTVDCVIVAVPDNLHREFAVAAFAAGKSVFLEKPVATTLSDANAILDAWQRSGKTLQLGYVLRQAPFYRSIRGLIREGILGPIRIASLSDQLDVKHGASFMRRWHSDSRQSGGLIVHKACHDLDILCWLLDAQPRAVSSFGGSDTFVGPAPATHCGLCERKSTCAYVDAALHERRTPAESEAPTSFNLDRCVFREDKDIIDNQVVSFLLDNGTRGTFYLGMQGPMRSERRIALVGDSARLDGVLEDGRYTVKFVDRREPLDWRADASVRDSHGGGDAVTMSRFLDACAGRGEAPVKSRRDALRGLAFAIAAEQARKEGRVVELNAGDFR